MNLWPNCVSCYFVILIKFVPKVIRAILAQFSRNNRAFCVTKFQRNFSHFCEQFLVGLIVDIPSDRSRSHTVLPITKHEPCLLLLPSHRAWFTDVFPTVSFLDRRFRERHFPDRTFFGQSLFRKDVSRKDFPG